MVKSLSILLDCFVSSTLGILSMTLRATLFQHC